MNTLTLIALFLVDTVFSLYILAVMLRFLLQWVKADFYNPFCQGLIKITNPCLVPLRKVIPGLFGLDCAAIVLMIILQLVALLLTAWLTGFPVTVYIFAVMVSQLLVMMLNVFFFAIIARAVASWFQPNPANGLIILLHQLTEPLLGPTRRRIKPIGGFDISPIVVLIVLQILIIIIRSQLG